MKRLPRNRRCAQGGYALVVLVGMTTILLIGVMAAAPNLLTQGRRERELEMIWRGKQYARGVKMYYRKMNRFPQSLDDLTKPKTGSIRFMRQAYKDPMNPKEEGEWRLIYVGPSGQLIGSLKPHQALQIPGATPAGNLAGGTAPGTPPAGTAGPLGTPQPGASQSGQAGQTGQTALSGGGTSPDAGIGAGDSGDDVSAASAPAPGESSPVFGGNIIGVGSKVNHRSLIVYDKAKNYRLFEFIWDPSKDTVTIGGQGQQIGTPAGQPRQNPLGQGQQQIPPQGPAPNPGPPTSFPPSENPNPPPQ